MVSKFRRRSEEVVEFYMWFLAAGKPFTWKVPLYQVCGSKNHKLGMVHWWKNVPRGEKLFKGGNYSREETIQGRKLLIIRRFWPRKQFKGGKYSREKSIWEIRYLKSIWSGVYLKGDLDLDRCLPRWPDVRRLLGEEVRRPPVPGLRRLARSSWKKSWEFYNTVS